MSYILNELYVQRNDYSYIQRINYLYIQQNNCLYIQQNNYFDSTNYLYI